MPIYLPRLPARVQRAQEWDPTTVLEAALAALEYAGDWLAARRMRERMDPGPVRACLAALDRLCEAATWAGAEDTTAEERARLRAEMRSSAADLRYWARREAPDD